MAGANSLVAYCDFYDINQGGYFNYDLSSEEYSMIFDNSKGDWEKKLRFDLRLLEADANFWDFLPEKLRYSSTHFLAASRDKKYLLAQKYSEDWFVSDLYWIDLTTNKTKSIIEFPEGTDGVGEISIDPKYGNYAVLRVSEDTLNKIYLINMQNGEIKNIRLDPKKFPYAFSWEPNSLGFSYSVFGLGTRFYNLNDSSQKLLIRDGYDADWSPDGMNLIFVDSKGDGWITDKQDQTRTPLLSSNGTPIRVENPEFVPIIGLNSIFYWDKHNRWVLHDLSSGNLTILQEPQELGGMTVVGQSVQWSPDGHWFIAERMIPVSIGYLPQIYVCNVDQQKCTALDANKYSDKIMCGEGWWMNSPIKSIPTPTPIEADKGVFWEFNTNEDFEGWDQWGYISYFQVYNGYLSGISTEYNPMLVTQKIELDADVYSIIDIRMSVKGGNSAQLYFTSPSQGEMDGFTESKSIVFPVNADGNFHIYTLDMSKVNRWYGVKDYLRFDPIDTYGAVFEIDYIRIRKP